MSRTAGRERLLLAGGVTLLTLLAGPYLAARLNTRDEAWFLQVVARVSDGDVLYRDVFFGTTPLSVWLTLPLVALLGAQIALVKLVVLAAFAATLALVAAIARQLGAGLGAALLLLAATFVLAPPVRSGLYQPLATVFLLACLSATLAWLGAAAGTRREQVLLLAAGGFAGLALASKQNVGLLTLAALLAAVLVAGAGRRLRACALAAAGLLACALLPLVPVLATGGLDKLVEYGLTAKGTYANAGEISYLAGLRDEAERAWDRLGGDALYAVPSLYEVLLFVLVPAAVVLLALAWTTVAGAERLRVAVVGFFALAAAAAVLPRADVVHVVYVAPVVLVGGWYALAILLRGRSPDRLRWLGIAVAVVLLPGLLVRSSLPALLVLDEDARLSTQPHMRGVLVRPAQDLSRRRTARAIARKSRSGDVFLATPEAGFYYLVSGVDNPTPYDYPLVTAFGRDGEAQLAATIERGGIEAVCLGYAQAGNLTPWLIVEAVKTTMERKRKLDPCRFFRTPPGVGQ